MVLSLWIRDALWWLSYRIRYEPAGAAIVEAMSLDNARMLAAIAGFDAGVTFTGGRALDDRQAAIVAHSEIGNRCPHRGFNHEIIDGSERLWCQPIEAAI